MDKYLLLVQEIRTVWDKRARGGKGAQERNAVPEAVRLPREVIEHRESGSLLYQRVIFDGRNDKGFAKPTAEAVLLEPVPQKPYTVGGVLIRLSEKTQTVEASFRYGYKCGAPDRTWMRKTLNLASGEWGRIVYNGRFVVEEGWWYEKTVVNVGLVPLPLTSGSLFLQNEPSQMFSAMAHLL